MLHVTTWSVWTDAEMNELIENVHHDYQLTIIYRLLKSRSLSTAQNQRSDQHMHQ